MKINNYNICFNDVCSSMKGLNKILSILDKDYFWFVNICGLPYGLELINEKLITNKKDIYYPKSKKIIKQLPELYFLTDISYDINLVAKMIDFFNEGYISMFAKIKDSDCKDKKYKLLFELEKLNNEVLIEVVNDALTINISSQNDFLFSKIINELHSFKTE